MKNKLFTALAVIALMFSLQGCSLLNSAASSAAPTASSQAQSVGASLKTLYSNYKTNETLDITDLSTLIDMKTVVAGAQSYKTNSTDPDYYKSFASGIINGSDNLVNSDNVTSVLSSLKGVAESTSSSIDTEATPTAASLKNSIPSLKSLLSSF